MNPNAPHPTAFPARFRPARHAVSALALALAVSASAFGPAGADSIPPPANLAAADALAHQAPSKDRDRALAKWARDASLSDLMYVLRLPVEQLGDAGPELARAALRIVPDARGALRTRLEAREALARGRVVAGLPHPYASVFRAVSMLPDSGDFGAFGQAVQAGFAVGIDAARRLEAAGEHEAARALLGPAAAPALPIDDEMIAVGDHPGALLAAFDDAAGHAGAFMGELLSVPTLVLGTAARYAGVALVSPTATDENVGAVSAGVFQVGPSGTARADALARTTVTEGRRIGVLVSSAYEENFFPRAFPAAATRRGGSVVWRNVYPAGNADFRDQVRALKDNGVELLFWDGEAREAEALLRQLARDKVSVAICGGTALDPDQYHAEVKLLLEGVTYAGDEWRLREPVAGALERTGFYAAADTDQRRALRVRGFLAGQAIRSAVEQGALCPEELIERLSAHVLAEPTGLGFLDFGAIVEIPVMRVQNGSAVAAQ